MSLTQQDAQLIASEIAKSLKSAGITGSGGGRGGSTAPQAGAAGGANFGGLDTSVKNTIGGFTDLNQAVAHAKSTYNSLSQTILENLNTWRDLSKVGASFSNDVVGMRAAAAGARLDMGEFADVIKSNSSSMTGFGGDVSRGAENFAKASKRMFDELGGTTDALRQMGYTNKDLNEILALTNVSSRAQFQNEEQRSKALTENATALAREMDLMAKLTGKSREDQMAQMRKNNADMQFEAALRSKMMEIDDPVKRAEFEKNARAQLAEAQNRGQGQMFKEVFATGQILSKEAATQASLFKDQSQATMKAAQVSSNTQMEGAERQRRAEEAQQEGRAAFNRDLQNKQLMLYASMGDVSGQVGKSTRDMMSSGIEYQRGLEATAAKHGLNLKNREEEAEAIRRYTEEAKASQTGLKENGEQTDAATKAIVNLGARAGDVESAMYNKLVVPLNEKVNPALDKLAEGALGANNASGERFVTAIEKQLEKGFSGARDAAGPIATLGKAASTTADALLKLAGVPAPAAAQPSATGQPPRRNFGSLGATGKLFENFGEGTLVELHGMESVMRPDDLKKVVQSSMSGMSGMLSKMPTPDLISGGGIGGTLQIKGFDTQALDKMSKEISATGQIMSKEAAMSAATKEKDNTPFVNLSKEIAATGQIMSKEAAMSAANKMTNMSSGTIPGIDLGSISKNITTSLSGLTSSIKIPDLKEFTAPFEKTFKDFSFSFGSITKTSAKKVEEAYDEFAGLDEAIAKQMPFDEFAGLDEAIKKQMPFDEFAGLDDFIAKQLPFDEFAGLDEAIAKQLPFDEFAGLDEAIAKQMAVDTEFGDLEGAMAKVAQDVNDEFGDLAGAMKAATERMYPDTEFGDLEGAMANVAKDIDTEFGDLEGAMAKVANDVDTEFGDLEGAMARVSQDVDTEFGDLAGAMKAAAERMAPDTEFGDLEGAMARASQDIDTEFGDLEGAMKYAQSQPYDEFGDLDGAIAAQQQPDEFGDLDGAIARQSAMSDLVSSTSPTAAQKPGRGIDINSFTLSPTGMPIPKPKSTASAVPDKPAAKQASAGKAINPETGEEYTPVGAATAAKPAGGSDTKSAAAPGGGSKNTLDDVVNALSALNSKVSQLITTSEQGYATIARSAKAGSNNLYERAKA